ncbi:UDP-glucose--hexose-1-phosphate uridylyltransferase [Domibacillus robiginosus]|uniref:UDP-glucose--hexose-1-phosphate uridylyltransferase n=1 Tax=Domibacillus robiginosus TaxID=1071054 RepID=UPI00067CCA9A|nr:UDP-glucose--hexose-1-phosphate uridylyltransferase [Domibacillus robiginosus]
MIFAYVEELIRKAQQAGLIEKRDHIYARNRLLALLKKNDFTEPAESVSGLSIPELVEKLTDEASAQGIVQPFLEDKEMFAADIMNIFISKPSQIADSFWKSYSSSPQQATDFFYSLSQASNYIQTKRIAKNISYKAETDYGELDITINLSKPEKDPAEIARAKLRPEPETNYPKCLLCVENEGYEGHANHPARANHRIVPMTLGEEEWFLQYSPYVYYNEHCILLSGEHRDMKIDRAGFERLLDFVHQFPHYFAGSNADLPIVGGSILTHDHYQGGRYEFAMAKAKEETLFSMQNFPAVKGATLYWPMSVIRLKSEDRFQLSAAAEHVLSSWKTYDDEACSIWSRTGETPHNTVTPIARKRGTYFELDLVLRNNRTTEEHPMGLFHPHADIHHIKRENIGLIEVMGLAVLPARLKEDLAEVTAFVADESEQVKEEHRDWAEGLRLTYDGQTNLEEFIRQAVAAKFLRGLEDCGVFKQTKEGKNGFSRFLNQL